MKRGNFKFFLFYTLMVLVSMVTRRAVADDLETMVLLDVIISMDKEKPGLLHSSAPYLPPEIISIQGKPDDTIPLPQQSRHRSQTAGKNRKALPVSIPSHHKSPPRPDCRDPAISQNAISKINSQGIPADQHINEDLENSRKQIKALNRKLTEQTASSGKIQDENQQNTEKLQQSLLKSQDKVAELSRKLAAVDHEGDIRINEINALQQKLTNSEKQVMDSAAKWETVQKELAIKEEKITRLSSIKDQTPAYTPKTAEEIRDYALGAYWAQEMEGIIEKKSGDSSHISRQTVLNGASDMMNNKLTVAKEKLAKVLQQLYKHTEEQKNNPPQPFEENGRQFLKNFSKEPGVKYNTMGYYYKVLEKGHKKINTSDTVAIVIRESLWNGKIVNDMNEKGTVLLLPLNQYPPLFKSVISMMNNHGSVQIVVPPELAYGQQGRPPLIPPDAVMLYEIKVVNATEKS